MKVNIINKLHRDINVTNTQGKSITLMKGHDYRIYPTKDPNKITLKDGKNVTVYEGELSKLGDAGRIAGRGEALSKI